MEVTAITVSVNYSDILKHILPNSKFFKEWIIVTTPEDDTNELIKNSGFENIKIIHFDGFYKDSVFNFGGARLFAQKELKNLNVLFLDGDILLPDTFAFPEKIENDTLYGVSERVDYHTLEDFYNNTNGEKYPLTHEFVGFFQLFKQSDKFYKNSKNCTQCDIDFKNMFKHRIQLIFSVKHLGAHTINHNGRKTTQF